MIVVLADDFSGAAEVAGVAHGLGASVELTTDWSVAGDASACQKECLIVDTDTRSLPAQQAADRLAEIARRIAGSGDCQVFKKIDSVLRGPVLAEAFAVAGVLGCDGVMIAGANPQHGRTVVQGRLFVDGVPVDETVFANDPEHPCHTSYVRDLLRLHDESVLPVEIAEASSLKQLEDEIRRVPDRVLICGAAAAFRAWLVGQLDRSESIPFSELRPQSGSLIACGSSAGSLVGLAQANACCPELKEDVTAQASSQDVKSIGTAAIKMNNRVEGPIQQQVALAVFDLADPAVRLADLEACLQADECVGIYVSAAARHEQSSSISHEARMQRIARAVEDLVTKGLVRQILVEGGRTAATVAAACGWKTFSVQQCFGEGIVSVVPTTDRGSKRSGTTLVTKPGSYAWPFAAQIAPSAKRFVGRSSEAADGMNNRGDVGTDEAVAGPVKPGLASSTAESAKVPATPGSEWLPRALRILALTLLTWSFAATSAFGKESQSDGFANDVLPILEENCNYCHGMPDEYPEGEFSLARFESRQDVVSDLPTWKHILDVVEGHEMPPAEDDFMTEPDRTRLVSWIRDVLAEPKPGEARRAGRPPLRRLTRLEYNNTVRDLLGLDTDVFMFSERLPFNKSYFDPAEGRIADRLKIRAREYGQKYPVLLPLAGLPPDSRAEHGFSNRGDAQDFSPVHLEQYVDLAERIAFHPELLQRAGNLGELFPNASFRRAASPKSDRPKRRQIVNASRKLAANDNVARSATGSSLSLEAFQSRLAQAFQEDRGGVYSAIGAANTTIAGKGGVLQVAFGANAARTMDINPYEDIWNAVFSSGRASSGDVILTNRQKDSKRLAFAFQLQDAGPAEGIVDLGCVLISRRKQSGPVLLAVRLDDGSTKSVKVDLKEGAGADNVFVSFSAPSGRHIETLLIDGSRFSGPYLLLDDIAFVLSESSDTRANLVGIEPGFEGLEKPEESFEAESAVRAKAKKTLKASVKGSVEERLLAFMQRAFRRPVARQEMKPYRDLYQSEKAQGNDEEQAMRRVLQALLCSPHFLYLPAGGAPASGMTASSGQSTPFQPLADSELASRLSYFLWSTMPDEELRSLAAAGKLQNESVLRQQVQRMLRDRRVSELSENFFVEWMRLRELWSVQPDAKIFKAYYDGPSGKRTLADDMFLEPMLLFEKILIENRSILELVHADYTFVNDELAKLYGMQPPKEGWQKVSLDDMKRGGVLTSAAMLTLTSYPHRTSSIRRGNWFLETILNRPPPAPKVAVADIDEQENVEELTLREKVELHRENSACAVCHDRIDPPGFVLENYDAIGRWRDRDGDEEINPSGTLPGFGEFADSAEFKQLLLKDRERFARGFTEHLLSYALSRELHYYDVATVDEIMQSAADRRYAFGDLITEIVLSHPFRNVDVR